MVRLVRSSGSGVSDAAISTILGDPNSQAGRDLKATYAPVVDNGNRLRALLDLQQAATVFVASDSTGDATEEWVHKWVEKLATQRPELRSAYYLWDDTSQALLTPEVINAGGPKPHNTLRDTFTRTAADIVGSTPDTGLAWNGQTGSWTIDGTNAVRSTAAAVAEVAMHGGMVGDMVGTWKGVVMNTTASTGFRWIRFMIKYLDTQNYLYLNVGISTGASRVWSIEQRIGNVITIINQGVNNPAGIPSNTAAAALADVTVSLVGLTFTAKVGSDTLTGTLTQAAADALALADGIGIRADDQLGMKVGEVTASVTPTANPTRTLAVYNGAKAGSDLTYQQSRLAAMCPVAPDLVMVSSSHNYSVDGPTYVTNVQAFIDACHTLWPAAGVVVMSQNPRKLPASAAGNLVHLQRCAALKDYARRKRWGYIPVMEAFLARPDQGASLVNPDGIHPSADGSLLWRDTVSAWFDNLTASCSGVSDAAISTILGDPNSQAGRDLKATYAAVESAKIQSPTVVLFGDSLTAQNGSGPNTLDPPLGSSQAMNGRGYAHWANAYLGQRCNLVYNAGVGGQVTSQMLARIDADVLAKDSDWVWFCGGANDVGTDVPLATIQTNITAILDRLAAKRVLVLLVPGSTSYNTTARRDTLSRLNGWLRGLPLTRRNVAVADPWRVTADPATGSPAVGMSSDGVIHWSECGAMRVGKVVSDTLSSLIPTRRSPFLGVLNTNNAIGNPHFGTNGSGWALLGSNVGATYQSADETWANKAVLTLSAVPDKTERGIQYTEPVANARYAAGDIVQAQARFKWSNGVAVTDVAGTFKPFLRVWARLADNSFTTYSAQAFLTASADSVQPVGYATSGDLVAITNRYTLPATVANLYVAVGWQGMASGVVEVSDLAVYKNA